jgi:hypothetical protein
MRGSDRDLGGGPDQPISVPVPKVRAGAILGGPSGGAEPGQVVCGECGLSEEREMILFTGQCPFCGGILRCSSTGDWICDECKVVIEQKRRSAE